MKTNVMQHNFEGLQKILETKLTFDAHLRIIYFLNESIMCQKNINWNMQIGQ